MSGKISIEQIERIIPKLEPEDQRKFLIVLPHLLKIHLPDFALLKLAEQSFDFWNNSEDAVYDNL